MTASEQQRRDVVVLGSTGSIGTQALDIVRAHPGRFRVVALTAGGSNREMFDAQVAEFAPAFSGLGADASADLGSRIAAVTIAVRDKPAGGIASPVPMPGRHGRAARRPTLAPRGVL